MVSFKEVPSFIPFLIPCLAQREYVPVSRRPRSVEDEADGAGLALLARLAKALRPLAPRLALSLRWPLRRLKGRGLQMLVNRGPAQTCWVFFGSQEIYTQIEAQRKVVSLLHWNHVQKYQTGASSNKPLQEGIPLSVFHSVCVCLKVGSLLGLIERTQTKRQLL